MFVDLVYERPVFSESITPERTYERFHNTRAHIFLGSINQRFKWTWSVLSETDQGVPLNAFILVNKLQN